MFSLDSVWFEHRVEYSEYLVCICSSFPSVQGTDGEEENQWGIQLTQFHLDIWCDITPSPSWHPIGRRRRIACSLFIFSRIVWSYQIRIVSRKRGFVETSICFSFRMEGLTGLKVSYNAPTLAVALCVQTPSLHDSAWFLETSGC